MNESETVVDAISAGTIKVGNVVFDAEYMKLSFNVFLDYSGLSEGKKYFYRITSSSGGEKGPVTIYNENGTSITINTSSNSIPHVNIPFYTEINYNSKKYSAIVDEDDLVSLFTNGGYGYLYDDITLTNDLEIGQDKVVDLLLNEKTLDISGVTLNNKGTLVLNNKSNNAINIPGIDTIVDNGKIVLGPINSTGDFYTGEATSDISRKTVGVDLATVTSITSTDITDSNNYSIDSDESTITINKDYLNTLSAGEYYFNYEITVTPSTTINYKIPVIVVDRPVVPDDSNSGSDYVIVNTCVK